MNDYELIIKTTKKIESLLTKHGASGKGLHEKVSSIENELDDSLVKKIRFIATLRNKFIHEEDTEFTEEQIEAFEKVSDEIFDELDLTFSSSSSSRSSSSSSSSRSSRSSSSSDYDGIDALFDLFKIAKEKPLLTATAIGGLLAAMYFNA